MFVSRGVVTLGIFDVVVVSEATVVFAAIEAFISVWFLFGAIVRV